MAANHRFFQLYTNLLAGQLVSSLTKQLNSTLKKRVKTSYLVTVVEARVVKNQQSNKVFTIDL